MTAARTPASIVLSLVVPAYQEGEGLLAGLRDIRASAQQTGLTFELIVVDDGSTDETWTVITRMVQEMPELIGVRLSRNFGKEGAIAAGLDLARGDACIVMDADLQHPPALVPQMVRRWQEGGWDVVEGVKTHRGRESAIHRFTIRTFYRIAAWLTGFDLQDACDFKLIDRRVLTEWRRLGERATFFRGLVAWLGFSRARVPFEVSPRQRGSSRWSLAALSGLAVHAVTSFSALPLQIVTIFGLAMLLVAVVIGVQAVRLWWEGLALPGFTTVILLQLIIGGFLMISLGIIGTYVARIYDEVKGRPRYVVRDTLGANRL
jgi:glycosyltransferase involved in cell wall biosynthesis